MKCNIKEGVQIDSEQLRFFQLDEKTKPGSEVEISNEVLWRVGVYDTEGFEEKLGHLFEKPKGGIRNRPSSADAKNVEAKEKKIAHDVAKVEGERREEIEDIATKEAKKGGGN